MKKIISILLTLLLVLSFAGCSGNEETPENNSDVGNSVSETEKNSDESSESGEITVEMVKNAKEASPEDFETEEVDGEIIINKYIGDAEIVSIPETINGKPVVALGQKAFLCIENLKGIRIPDTVKEICEEAFSICSNLEIFVSGAGLETIGLFSFNSCTKLRVVELNDGLKKIVAAAFYANDSLKELRIPSSVEEIGEIFHPKQDITIISSPGSVAEIYAKDHGYKFEAR